MSRIVTRLLISTSLAILLVLVSGAVGQAESSGTSPELAWTAVNDDAPWDARAGLQVVQLRNALYLMGGRTPRPPSFPPIFGDSDIWGDVWRSRDRGVSWVRVLDTDDDNHWPARAYFEAVTKDGQMFVMGGQNFKVVEDPDCPPPFIDCYPFIPDSDFFNDVWSSFDGVNWTRLTGDAGWEPRAGLSAAVFNGYIYVLGGSQNDDESVGGPGGPARIYFNDVWKSRDGENWMQVTDNAPWSPRAGARVVVKDGYLYLLGGEEGFFCQQPCDPPYFNDVWRTGNGRDWELVTSDAEWSPRPGHMALVIADYIVLFGGFGLSTNPGDPFGSDNPMDVWVSRSGERWVQVSDSPWNAVFPDQVKYDFDALVLGGGRHGRRPAIYTFGGDREDFDFTDPLNYLNVDNDVWRFAPRPGGGQ